MYLELCDTPIGSGLGTVSTCISSNISRTMDCHNFPREVAGVVIILYDAQLELKPCVILTSRHKLCARMVVKPPSER